MSHFSNTFFGWTLLAIASSGTPVALAQPASLQVTVTSNQDTVQPDEGVTLREAIQLVNGTRTLEQLSPAERSQVQTLSTSDAPRIQFNLPADQTSIRLTSLLPPLDRPGTVIDGTTQPGYQTRSVIQELPIAAPVVAIAPVDGTEIFRGLTITADNVTVRGLSLYGFTSIHTSTAGVPPADIFISHRLPPPDISKQPTPANAAPYYPDDLPPKNVVIEDNWLGFPPSDDVATAVPTPETRSAFGVSIFNASGTIVRRNWIANHDGSGIITSVNADGAQIRENVITGNGVAGMPDAIRLEGSIRESQIAGNLICANDGSGVYLFKPDGSVQIQDNLIVYNGRRLRRAAVYVMGSNHAIRNNQIRYQVGPGVVVSAVQDSRNVAILDNRFSDLEGLSIDLVQRQGAGVFDFQRGDGVNPLRDSGNRHKDTGNAGVNAPQFVSREFLILADTVSSQSGAASAPVQVFGKADPNTRIDIYRVAGINEGYGPLNEAVATTTADSEGKFSVTVNGLRISEQISAIATHPTDGTSEPARNATVRSLTEAAPVPLPSPIRSIPRCVTPPQPEPPPPEPVPPEPITIQVPTRIHFALDSDRISPKTAPILERIAQVMRENPVLVVEIEGHADPRASDAYNLNLAARRARSARNYLLRRGIAPERMTLRSRGERQRLSRGSSRLDYARDRRVEFIFQDARGLQLIVQEQDLQLEP